MSEVDSDIPKYDGEDGDDSGSDSGSGSNGGSNGDSNGNSSSDDGNGDGNDGNDDGDDDGNDSESEEEEEEPAEEDKKKNGHNLQKTNCNDLLHINEFKNYDFSKNNLTPFINKYEKTTLIGIRAEQLSNNAPTFLTDSELDELLVLDSISIAKKEFEFKDRFPFIIKRPISGEKCEYWKFIDLE